MKLTGKAYRVFFFYCPTERGRFMGQKAAPLCDRCEVLTTHPLINYEEIIINCHEYVSVFLPYLSSM